MGDDIKMPIFRGLGSEDPDQFWFVANALWKERHITKEDVNKAQLIMMLRERALTWYMNYSMTNQVALMDDIKKSLVL